MLRELLKSESGLTNIEYGLIAALVAVVAIPAMGAIGDELQTEFSTVGSTISGAAVAGGDGGSGSGDGGIGSGDGGSGGDPVVGEGTTVESEVDIGANAEIGSNVQIK